MTRHPIELAVALVARPFTPALYGSALSPVLGAVALVHIFASSSPDRFGNSIEAQPAGERKREARRHDAGGPQTFPCQAATTSGNLRYRRPFA